MLGRVSWLRLFLGLSLIGCDGHLLGEESRPAAAASTIPAGAVGAVGADYQPGAGGYQPGAGGHPALPPRRYPPPPPTTEPTAPPEPGTSAAPGPSSAPAPLEPPPAPSSISPEGIPL